MSRAFVNEDAGSGGPKRRFELPPRDDPGFLAAAADVMLRASLDGETASAEEATGFYWGAEALRADVERLLEHARRDNDDALVRAAERYLR
ncbi:MAG TPA: hypothetical protein VJO52_00995 [Gemmatimonadaceae bacterium]|nr:hypothetical protein [Gemmatimonadaceae bacterium]